MLEEKRTGQNRNDGEIVSLDVLVPKFHLLRKIIQKYNIYALFNLPATCRKQKEDRKFYILQRNAKKISLKMQPFRLKTVFL